MNQLAKLTPKKADVRIIAATNRNLEEMIKNGTFREDLFYRLNVVMNSSTPEKVTIFQFLLTISSSKDSEENSKKVSGLSREASEN